MSCNSTNIKLTRGDDFSLSLELDFLESFTVTRVDFTVKYNSFTENSLLNKFWESGSASGIEKDGNLYKIYITGSDTENWEYGNYRYDVQIKYTDGTTTKTLTAIKPSLFAVLEEVTWGEL